MQALTAYAGQKLIETAVKKVEKKMSKPSESKRRTRKNPRRGKKNVKPVSSMTKSLAQIDSKDPLAYRRKKMNRNYALGMSAPVSYDSVVCNFEEMFRPKEITHPEYGAGSVVAFSSIICTVGTNAEPSNSANLFPFVFSSLIDNNFVSGFIDSKNRNCTGILIHPRIMGTRMNAEQANWGLWRPRRLGFKYQTSTGTDARGSLTLTLARDPAAFVECNPFSTGVSPTPSVGTLTQTVPNTMSNVYRDSILEMTKFPAKPYWCQFAAASQFGNWNRDNDLATVAYDEDRLCGRIVGLLDAVASTTSENFGYLWCEGEIEFYQPTANNYNIGTTTNSFGSKGPSRNTQLIDRPNLLVAGEESFSSVIELCTRLPEFRKCHHRQLIDYLHNQESNLERKTKLNKDYAQLIRDMKLPELKPLLSTVLRIGRRVEPALPVDEKSTWLTIGKQKSSSRKGSSGTGSQSDFEEVSLETPGQPLKKKQSIVRRTHDGVEYEGYDPEE